MNQRHCRVRGCVEPHQNHYCRNCGNNDSDHFAKQCNMMNNMQNNREIQKNGFNQGNFFNGPPNNTYFNQGYGPQRNYQAPYHQKNSPDFKDKVKNFFMGQNKCKAPGCQQDHAYHYCKFCKNRDSNHKSSFCPLYEQSQQRNNMMNYQMPRNTKPNRMNPQMKNYGFNKPQQVHIKIDVPTKSNEFYDQKSFKNIKTKSHKGKPSYYSDSD